MKTKNELIQYFRDNGFNVIPCKPQSKDPALDSWKQYQIKRYDGIIPQQCNYALPCGYNNLIVLDLDNKEFLDDFKEFSEKTLTVKTKKGYHLYFKHIGDKLPRTLRLQNGKGHIDLQSAGAYVIGPGSIHPETKQPYEIITDKPILEIDIQFIIIKLEELGFNPKQKKSIDDLRKPSQEGNRNQDLFDYLKEYRKLHPETTFETLFSLVKERNRINTNPLDERELETIVKSNFTYDFKPKLEQINKEEKKREKRKVKGNIGPYFVESILVDSKPTFLCNKSGSFSLEKEIEYDGIVYKPIENFGYLPFEFSEEEINRLLESNITKEELLNEVKKQTDHFIDIYERERLLISSDLLLTFSQEWIDTLHYIYCVGETESGKSTVLYLFKWLAYRCMFSDDLPNADIYNFLGEDEEAAGVIAEDEAQDIAFNRDKMSTYKTSYARGSLKPRIKSVDSQHKTQVFYKTFCFKIFAGEYIPENKGFKERLAVIHMTEGLPSGNIKRPTTQEREELIELRNKLLVWKVKNYFVGLELINTKLEKRDQELWEDFLRVVNGTKYFADCEKVVEYYIKQRHEAIWNSIEARIFKVLMKRLKLDEKDIVCNLENFWQYIVGVTDKGDPELEGELDKQTFYPSDFNTKITRNKLAKLFSEKYQGVRRQVHEVQEDGKQHLRTLYIFDSIICSKLAKKYNLEIPVDCPIYSSG